MVKSTVNGIKGQRMCAHVFASCHEGRLLSALLTLSDSFCCGELKKVERPLLFISSTFYILYFLYFMHDLIINHDFHLSPFCSVWIKNKKANNSLHGIKETILFSFNSIFMWHQSADVQNTYWLQTLYFCLLYLFI